jgi:hypothetical protein
MSLAFVPLIPGALSPAGSSMPARVKPISAPPSATFELTTPAKLKSETTAPAVGPVAAAVQHVQHGPPKVTLERQGETITHIRIECSCGQVTELKCEY